MARLDEIAELLCVNSRWLRTGEGVKHPSVSGLSPNASKTTTAACHDADVPVSDIAVPFYNEVLSPNVSGKTRVVEIPDHHVRLSLACLHAMDVNPDLAICAPMIGNSMACQIQHGSTPRLHPAWHR